MRRMPLLVGMLVVSALVVPSRHAQALDPLALYDNFSAAGVNKTKWIGGEGASFLGRDAARLIQNGKLQLRSRSVGFTAADTGVGSNFIFLGFPNPTVVNEMRATIALTNVTDQACSTNPSATQSAAVLIGAFFNTGTSSAGDETGDVIAAVGIQQDSQRIAAGKSPHVVGIVLECADSSCNTFTNGNTPVFAQGLGSVALGTAATVTLTWDEANQKFTFGKDNNPVVSFSYSGTLADNSSPGIPYRNLEVLNLVANCMTGTPKPAVANTSALFSDVFLNQCAVNNTCS